MKLKDTIVLLNEDAPSLTGASTLKRDKLIIRVTAKLDSQFLVDDPAD
ncbi:MAG: hypothetical protein SPF32_02715 [Lactobacillus johnsonii]|nr:hypothetical protein [Lactobacillus johnsonii]